MTRALVLILAVGGAAWGCSGGTTTPEGGAEGSGAGGEAAMAAGQEARAALERGDLDAAERAATTGLEGGDPEAREVAALVALARGQDDRLLTIVGDRSGPLAILRARVHLRRGDLAAVREDLGGGVAPEDPWATAALAIAEAGGDAEMYRFEGRDRATLPMDSRTPLPVVQVTVDGQTLNALIATSADLTVVDTSVMDAPGVLGRLEMGTMSLYGVPALSRDLGPISEGIGARVHVVLGTDVILRTRMTIDGQERWAVVRREGSEAGPDAHSLPFVTLSGSFLAVRASVARPGPGAPEADGWFLLDTAGVFPVALAEETAQALELGPDNLEEVEGAPSPDVRQAHLGRVQLGSLVIEDAPGVTGLVSSEVSAAAGSRVSGMLGALMLAQLKLSFDPDARQVLIE